MPENQQMQRWMERLIEGNRRFVQARATHPDQTLERRLELQKGQHPFAAIVGCADSRVPPEIVFDQGLGNLFVVRVAGNVIDDMVLGSLEYAVAHLQVPLIVVLGHTACGAIKAALTDSGEPEGHVTRVISAIKPSIAAAALRGADADADAVSRIHAVKVAEQLRAAEPIIRPAVAGGKVEIVAAVYDIRSGVVEFAPETV